MGATPSRTREVNLLVPSDPAQRPLPDPIPTSHYARPPGASQAAAQAPPAWHSWVSSFRIWPVWKRVLVALACLAGVISIVQAPWRLALWLFAFLSLATVILATGARRLRARQPIRRSENPPVVPVRWAVIGALVLVATILALVAPSSLLGRQHATRLTSPELVGPPPVAHVPSPTIPVATPLATPRPAPTPVSFLNAPLSAQRGQTVTLRAVTAPGTDCSIDVGYPSELELDSATSDAAGNVSWTWRVGKHVRPGSWPITISCRTGTAGTQITVG